MRSDLLVSRQQVAYNDLDVRKVLIERFAPDVELLGEVMGKSYADWLSPVGRGTYSTRSS